MDGSADEAKVSQNQALVVDDGPVERQAGKAMLEKLGFSVETAGSGEEAMSILTSRKIDLVLCDISMPGMDGLHLLEMTRELNPPPVFIMSTNHDDAEHAFASLRRGAYGYLTKPLRFDSLRVTIADAMTKFSDDRNSAIHAERLAQQDPLTKLINRGEFLRQLARRLEVLGSGEERGAMLLLKIYGLNHVNHSYSRIEGDKLLQFTANALLGLTRSTDILARFGGDAFAIFLDGIPPNEVERRANGIVEAIEGMKTILGGEAYAVSLMVGGACANSLMSAEDLLNQADFALHVARERGRQHVRIYSRADEVHKLELSHQLNTLAVVRAALADPARLAMFYQPIIDLNTRRISHYEALLRVFDEHGKPCNTGELVKTCEVFGLIGRLDRAVIMASLSGVSSLPEGTGVAINLSGKSIGDPELLHLIEEQICLQKIDPSRLIFELTETAAFYNLEEVRQFVGRIKSLGCRFALDDFGVGFSSFYYIKELDFDYLKLDGSFIKSLPRSQSDQVFVRAMVEISKVFGMSVIAEWVEDEETATILQGFGVTYGQGYYFGKPQPLSQLAIAFA
ncbi:MAG: hypothetical protein K0S28_699 [Paucimonas sp.]|nr:hypothetical protein [Paucimonas sp.]